MERHQLRDEDITPGVIVIYTLLRFEAIYGNTREVNRGSAFSPEASLEQARSKQRETDL